MDKEKSRSPLREVLRRLTFKDKTNQAVSRPSRHPDGRPATPPKLPEVLLETPENHQTVAYEEYRARPDSSGSLEVAHVDGRLILRANGLLLQNYKVIPEGSGWKVVLNLDPKSLNNSPNLNLSPWETTPYDTPPQVRRNIVKPYIPLSNLSSSASVTKPEMSPVNRLRNPLRG